MKAVVKNGIGVLSPQGFLDGNTTGAFLTHEEIEATSRLKIDMLLVSLKKVIFFNHNGLNAFVKLFDAIRKKNHIGVGFCDYDEKKYDAIKNFYKDDLNFSLFKTIEIAYLFSSNFKDEDKDKNVLISSRDKSQRTAIAMELHDNGYNPIIAKDRDDFLSKKDNESAYAFVVNATYLGQMGQKIASRVSGNAVIYTVSSFIDVEINEDFNMDYHNNSLNVGFRLFIFDAYKVISMNIHALNFFSKLSSSAAEYNATICIVGMSFEKIPEKFKENMEDGGVLFYENMDDILQNKELLKELGASSSANIKNKRAINKATVTELPRFIDATVLTIEMMTNSKAVKNSATVQAIVVGDKTDKIASSIGYYGDLDGMVILVFPKGIAKKACELLIGESTDDLEMILDTLAELVNIVGGKIKALLADQDIRVNITLPRTYQDVDSLLKVVDNKKGVQVDLTFNNDKFVFFLTR